jgi:hypothetical protein
MRSNRGGPRLVREHAGVAEDQVIMKSIALGCKATYALRPRAPHPFRKNA